MKPIRILEAIRQGSVGGGETHVFDLSTRLDKSKFVPIVLSFTDGPMVSNLRQAGIETHVIETKMPFDPRVIARVRQLIHDTAIDFVHAHGTRAASNLLLPSKISGRKLIYTIHGWSFNNSQSKAVQFIRTQAEKFITQRTALNICVSESNRQTGAVAIHDFKAIVINNGINLNRFNLTIDNTSFLTELNKTPGQIWIGLIARMTRQKDPITLLHAFQLAQSKQTNLRLLLVGEGDLTHAINNKINELNIVEYVRVMPFRKDVPEILKSIDIYCLPSLWEGLPIGLIEAMAMERPAIATKVDGTREVVTSETGLLIEPENINELVASILKLAENESLRSSMGKRARLLAEAKFGLDAMVLATEQAYLQIMH